MEDKVKELLEKARLTADLAMDTAVKAAGVAAQKGGQLMERTKRSFQMLDLNNEVDLLLRDIGRMVYLTHTGAETDQDALQAKLEEIDKKYAHLAQIKEEVQARRSTVVCPTCGKTCDKTDLYCRVCGEKL